MIKFLTALLICHNSHADPGGFQYKMHQVSVWIEHRYATTEIGIWVNNESDETEKLDLSYDLKRSDYIHDLYALMGNERYEGKVYEREVADEKCRLAESNGRPCIHISNSAKNPKDANIYRKFNYHVSMPPHAEIKVWIRYSSIIFQKEEKFVYELNNFLQNSKGIKHEREVFQVYISELQDLKGTPRITCNNKQVTLPPIKDMVAEDYEFMGMFNAEKGDSGLCSGGRKGRRSRRDAAESVIKIEYEVERGEITKFIDGRPKKVEDHHGDILIQDHHFLHIVHNKDIQTRPPKRIIFILDRSGSMSALVPKTGATTRLTMTIKAIKTVLTQIEQSGTNDEFNIISFSGEDDFTSWKSTPQDKSMINAANEWLDQQVAGGSTYLKRPLLNAINMCMDASTVMTNTIIVLTDGEFWDEEQITGIISEAEKTVKDRQLQINTISLGTSYYTDQMGKLAYAFQGTYEDITGVDEVETLLFKFYEKTSIPLFYNVQVNYTNVEDENILFENTIFDGQELMIIGKLDDVCDMPMANFELGDDFVDDPEAFYMCTDDGVVASFDFTETDLTSNRGSNAETSIERMYNYYKIMKNLRRLPGLIGTDLESTKLSIIESAKKYNFVTDLTSLYLDNSREFIVAGYDDEFTLNQEIGGGARGGGGPDRKIVRMVDTFEFCSTSWPSFTPLNLKLDFYGSTNKTCQQVKLEWFKNVIKQSNHQFYFEEMFVTYNKRTTSYDEVKYNNSNAETKVNLCKAARTKPGVVVLLI